MPQQVIENREHDLGLDKPLPFQYLAWVGSVVRGDFGISFTQENRRVNDIIREHFPVSATLGILAMAFATLGGVLWGARFLGRARLRARGRQAATMAG